MKYCIAFILNFICLSALFAQDELRLISSRYSTIIDQQGFSSIQPVYSHKGNTLSADSGIIYEDEIGRQFFEAFGNVVITQPSGTMIYADRLHYDASPQIATLTNNVRMVDDNSVLTTDHLIYKMRDKIGNYINGGRIISKTDTITSLNAYYFENSSDAYFRNKVIVRTADVKIYTDTMRYNSDQRMTYFFGPTNIKGNSGENLYTERGHYHTVSGIADFNKNNLYTEGTRFLKGDSLHYERETGIGEAFQNVVFVDTLDKFYAYGGYGLYDQSEESITMTEKPLIVMVVQNDSTASDSTAKHTDIATDSLTQNDPIAINDSSSTLHPANDTVSVDSVYMTADTLYSRMIMLRDYQAKDFKLDRNGGKIESEEDIDYGALDDNSYGDGEEELILNDSLVTDDSLALNDSLQLNLSQIDSTINKLPIEPKRNVLIDSSSRSVVDSSKQGIPLKEAPRANIARSMAQDSILRQKAILPQENTADSLLNRAITVAQTPDSIKTPTQQAYDNPAYLDTARTRIVKAYYNVRMYKSDLQAVADSVYYGMADSMFRFMGHPMIWAEGSQISSDTLYMQIKNQRMDNALLINNAFMVNAVLDTLKFNQLKGRKITAFFANNSIDRMYVDGNAENITFATNDKTHRITEMFHDRGARIKIKMEGKQIIDYITVRKVDQKVYPIQQVTDEIEVLPGFIWRPQDRPTSKEDMMNRKREVQKTEQALPEGGTDTGNSLPEEIPEEE